MSLPSFAQRRFAIELSRLGYRFQGADRLVIDADPAALKVGVERTAFGNIDYDATLAKARAARALYAATAERLAVATMIGHLADRARFGGVAGRA